MLTNSKAIEVPWSDVTESSAIQKTNKGTIRATASVEFPLCPCESVASSPNPNPFNPLAEILVWGLLAALATGFIGCVWYAVAYATSPQRTIDHYEDELLESARAAQTTKLEYKALVTEVESKGLNPSEIAPHATTLMTEDCND
jgi:hypothetical protein